MNKALILLIIVGGLVGIGIILSFYGNQIVFEDLKNGDDKIKFGKDLIISVELNSSENQNGIYAIQIIEFKERVITASVIDPFNTEIVSQSLINEVFEGKFDIKESGTYQLKISSVSNDEIQVFGVIGPEPDEGKKSLGIISLYILIIGLIGMVVAAIYTIKNRKSSFS